MAEQLAHSFETLDPKTTSEWNCEFTNYLGDSEEMSAIIKQMSIYESIYTNCMSGAIILEDGTGMIEAIPIIGEEFLEVSMQSGGGKIAPIGNPGQSSSDVSLDKFS